MSPVTAFAMPGPYIRKPSAVGPLSSQRPRQPDSPAFTGQAEGNSGSTPESGGQWVSVLALSTVYHEIFDHHWVLVSLL